MSITDPIKNAFIYALLAAVGALSLTAWLGHARLGIAIKQRDAAKAEVKRLGSAIAAQKTEAAAILAAANRSVLAQQARLDAAARQQEVADGKNQQVVDRARADLRALRVRLAAQAGGGGSSGGGGAGQDSASAGAGAGDPAKAARLVPAAEADEGDEDAFDADQINIAYASCRSDALSVRAILKQKTPP